MASTSLDDVYEQAMSLRVADRLELLRRLELDASPLSDEEEAMLAPSREQAARGEFVGHDEVLRKLQARRAR